MSELDIFIADDLELKYQRRLFNLGMLGMAARWISCL